MAYNIYVFARPDSGIYRTRVLRSDTSESTYVYKGSGNNDWYMTTFSDVTGVVEIYAEPDDGYVFIDFVHRIGSDTAQEQHSDSNPFVYYGDKDLFIRAVAEEGSPTIHIDEFDWNASNGNATASQTRKAYQALANKGKLKDFSYLVWNDMVDKLYEVITKEGSYWSNIIADYSSTKMTTTDRKMTAVRFNSFASNMISFGIKQWAPVKKGDPIIGQTFLDLIDSLNTYIQNNH